jgi:hypothetical protein
MSGKAMFRHANGFISEEFDAEFLIFRLGTHKAIHLNQMAGVIWRMCDGSHSVDDIVALLSESYPDDTARVSRDVSETVGKLQAVGALLPC